MNVNLNIPPALNMLARRNGGISALLGQISNDKGVNIVGGAANPRLRTFVQEFTGLDIDDPDSHIDKNGRDVKHDAIVATVTYILKNDENWADTLKEMGFTLAACEEIEGAINILKSVGSSANDYVKVGSNFPFTHYSKMEQVGTKEQLVYSSSEKPLSSRAAVNWNNIKWKHNEDGALELSESSRRTLDAHRLIDEAMHNLIYSGESTGDSVRDLAIIFNSLQPFSVDASDRFVKGETFTQGEIVRYNERYWEILQDFTHNGDLKWRPGLAHSLFSETSLPSKELCPYLSDAFINLARVAFANEAIREMRFEKEAVVSPGGEVLFRTDERSSEDRQRLEDAFIKTRQYAETFANSFLRNVMTLGHEAAFEKSISLVR